MVSGGVLHLVKLNVNVPQSFWPSVSHSQCKSLVSQAFWLRSIDCGVEEFYPISLLT